MARYSISRKINDKETINVEQCHSFDEAFKILEKGEHELKLMHEDIKKIAAEQKAKKEEEEEKKATPVIPHKDDVSASNTLSNTDEASVSNTDTPKT